MNYIENSDINLRIFLIVLDSNVWGDLKETTYVEMYLQIYCLAGQYIIIINNVTKIYLQKTMNIT